MKVKGKKVSGSAEKRVFRCCLKAKTPKRDVTVNYDHAAPKDEALKVTFLSIGNYLLTENSQALEGAYEIAVKIDFLQKVKG